MISVVIPVYNEAGCLRAHVDALRPLLRELAGADWEIVLVDDGSHDGTAQEIAALSAADPAVRGCTHAVNRGKGAAVRTGVLATRGDAVLFCDADMSTPPETLREFLAALEAGADVVIGNRKSGAARIERWQPPLRTWLGLGFTRLSNVMTGMSVSDYTCGFKLFRGDPGRAVFAETETDGWVFDAEVLARAARRGLVIREIPVRWSHVDDTRVRVLRDVLRSFAELWALRRRLKRQGRSA
ncbi:MAG TPA: glycosyltransferase, partial [Candidatus Limnocylindrales bacterium]|nr:glycosyltransferase [Candidatus Limnocylindrales bacterium]